MAALTAPRATPYKAGFASTPPVAAGALIHRGALIVMAAGYAEPGHTAAGLIALGIADQSVDNRGGIAGAQFVTTQRGTFCFMNLATDAVSPSDIGKDCYIADDQTVAKTHGGNTRSVAGVVVDVDGAGVWVRVGWG